MRLGCDCGSPASSPPDVRPLSGSGASCRTPAASSRPTISSLTATDDHGTLPVHAERMLRRLETIENLAVPRDTAHMQHMDHAKRVRQLAHHLRAVLLLSEANHYASALIVVRSALEHHLMDR